MAKGKASEVIIISDSEEERKPKSPLTSIKPKSTKKASAKRSVKRLASVHPKNQTKLDSFFQTITIKNEKKQSQIDKFFSSKSDEPPRDRKSSAASLMSSKPFNVFQSSPPMSSLPIKRTAMKGMSPRSKIANREKEKLKIINLKGK